MSERSLAEREIAASAAVAPQPPGTGELAPGVVTTLTPLIRRVIASNPTPMTGPGTNTYLAGPPTGAAIPVDPGPPPHPPPPPPPHAPPPPLPPIAPPTTH